MKRILLLVCFSILLSIAILLNCYIVTKAQTFDFNRAYQDYLYSFNLYRTSYQNYLSAKNEYQAYKTLNAETKALKTTRQMLQNRTEALRTYLTALRMKLGETTNIINYQQNLEYLKLDIKTTWLVSHKETLAQTNSIADLLLISSQLEQKYPETELLSYQTLGTVLAGKQNALRAKIVTQSQKIEDKLNQIEIEKEGQGVSLLENWLIEARKKLGLSEEKQREGETILKALKVSNQSKKREFERAQAAFEQSNQYLKDAAAFLMEIIQEISKA